METALYQMQYIIIIIIIIIITLYRENEVIHVRYCNSTLNETHFDKLIPLPR